MTPRHDAARHTRLACGTCHRTVVVTVPVSGVWCNGGETHKTVEMRASEESRDG